MKDFVSKNKKLTILGLIVLVVGYIIFGTIQTRKEDAYNKEVAKELEESEVEYKPETQDEILLSMQEKLIEKYGILPEGFIWSDDGELLSLGDKDMPAEDVVYAYLRGLSSLDISTAQRFSRKSLVVSTYGGFFDSGEKDTDYYDMFMRKMYKQCLLSIQVEGVQDSAVFAENKKVFTVKAKMIDLMYKDFWRKDEKNVFDNLYAYRLEEDSIKAEIYLYDYILRYYESAEVTLRDITFDLTVQRYPDLKSGWLVSIDTDINDACLYRDGNLVVNYVLEEFNKVLDDYKEAEETEESLSLDDIEEEEDAQQEESEE